MSTEATPSTAVPLLRTQQRASRPRFSLTASSGVTSSAAAFLTPCPPHSLGCSDIPHGCLCGRAHRAQRPRPQRPSRGLIRIGGPPLPLPPGDLFRYVNPQRPPPLPPCLPWLCIPRPRLHRQSRTPPRPPRPRPHRHSPPPYPEADPAVSSAAAIPMAVRTASSTKTKARVLWPHLRRLPPFPLSPPRPRRQQHTHALLHSDSDCSRPSR